MRTAEITRKTKETDIYAKINLDVQCENNITTGIGFFDHMLTAFAVHSGFSLTLNVKGDLEVDGHHTVEDTGIILGQAFKQALEKTSDNATQIMRYGTAFIPMDEALGFCSLDICNRPYLEFNATFYDEKIGDYDSCLTEEFFRAFAMNSGITLHIKSEYGKNSHHITEALFKSFAHALKAAVKVNNSGILSTKGVL